MQTQFTTRSWLALTILCATQFMMVLDFFVNVALFAIERDLGFSSQHLQ